MPLPTLYSKDSVDNLLADKLDLAGGTMTGGLTLSATGIIFSDSTTLTTAPAGGTLAADQLTAGVVATNPAAGPTTAGDVLQYDGTDLIWAAGGGGGLTISSLSNGATSTLNAAAPTTGQYLSFDGTELIWATPTAPDTAADQLTNGTVVTNPAAGPTAADEVLTYDGTDLVWAAPVASVAWGGITGTLSSQTDLNTALNQKASEAQAIAAAYGSAIRWDGTDVLLYVGTDYIYNNFITNGQTFGWLISSTITAITSISAPAADSAGNYYVTLNSSGSPDVGSSLYYSTDSGTTWSNSYTPIR